MTESLSDREKRVARVIERILLPWFGRHARRLPWRTHRTPYRVWVAEVMLQQTRVETVVPYYRRWMRCFPSWRALANASQDDVLKCWEGLGYYSRARNLQAAAQVVVTEYGGNVRRAWHGRGNDAGEVCRELRTFPGVGDYMAAAIGSLAFGVDAAVLDGNVMRVLTRVFAYHGDIRSTVAKRRLQAWATSLMVSGRAGEFNEAMMELGATVCLPRNPTCDVCPLCQVCAAFDRGGPERFPRKSKKKRVPHIIVGAAVIANRRGEILIAQRRQTDMLGGLWEFPGGKREPGESIQECIRRELMEELGVRTTIGSHLMTIKHAYSHFTMTMHVHHARIASGRPRLIECADYAWVPVANLDQYPYSKADLFVFDRLMDSSN